MFVQHKTLEERMSERTQQADGCWLWTGYTLRGYGRIMVDGRNRPAHRIAWELANGRPVPEGLVIDHLCRVTNCVNPTHLEPVTSKVNTLRGINPASINARKTHCKRGHEFTPENTYWNKKGRACRECANARRRPIQNERIACEHCGVLITRGNMRVHIRRRHSATQEAS